MKIPFVSVLLSIALLLGDVTWGMAIERVREDPSALEQGMHFHEVIQRWGPPLAKEEFEVLREELWSFRGYAVRFREGLLVSVEGRNEPGKLTLQDEGDDISVRQQGRPEQPIEGEALAAELGLDRTEKIEIADILSEIMQSAPDSADGGPSIPARLEQGMAVMPSQPAEVIGEEEY